MQMESIHIAPLCSGLAWPPCQAWNSFRLGSYEAHWMWLEAGLSTLGGQFVEGRGVAAKHFGVIFVAHRPNGRVRGVPNLPIGTRQ